VLDRVASCHQYCLIINIYIGSVIKSLVLADLGCHIQGTYIGCVVYADDIILLSASVGSLQKMLDICYVSGTEIDIVFNAKNHFCLLLIKHMM